MKSVNEEDKNKVTAVMKYFKDNMQKINPKVGYDGGYVTEKFSIDNSDTQYAIVFNDLTLFNKIKALIFESGSLVPIEEVSIIKCRAAIVPNQYFLVDPVLYDYILCHIRMASIHSTIDSLKDENDSVNDKKKKIEDFEIKM